MIFFGRLAAEVRDQGEEIRDLRSEISYLLIIKGIDSSFLRQAYLISVLLSLTSQIKVYTVPLQLPSPIAALGYPGFP
jgi:hypothetical protein